MTDAVIHDAKKMRDQLQEVAAEIRRRPTGNPKQKRLDEVDAKTCDQAAVMLEKLGTEVTRLRLGIGHYRYGQIERVELIRMADTWNGDPT